MEYTRDKWEVEHIGNEGKCVIHTGDFTLPFAHTFPNRFRSPQVSSEEAKANANLIVEAVNACIDLNPDCPLAVAQSIKELYEGLADATAWIRVLTHNKGVKIKDYEQVLAKADSK